MLLSVTKRHWVLTAVLVSLQVVGLMVTYTRTGHLLFPATPVSTDDWYLVLIVFVPWISCSAFVTSLIVLGLLGVMRTSGNADDQSLKRKA